MADAVELPLPSQGHEEHASGAAAQSGCARDHACRCQWLLAVGQRPRHAYMEGAACGRGPALPALQCPSGGRRGTSLRERRPSEGWGSLGPPPQSFRQTARTCRNRAGRSNWEAASFLAVRKRLRSCVRPQLYAVPSGIWDRRPLPVPRSVVMGSDMSPKLCTEGHTPFKIASVPPQGVAPPLLPPVVLCWCCRFCRSPPNRQRSGCMLLL